VEARGERTVRKSSRSRGRTFVELGDRLLLVFGGQRGRRIGRRRHRRRRRLLALSLEFGGRGVRKRVDQIVTTSEAQPLGSDC
jgi:hypothetical protein